MVDYLYHYTSLEALKLILQNKTFRLSSLNRMDDLEEGDTKDLQKFGRFIYISSWTNNPKESLLLWSYSRGNNGVRLRMKPNIFKTKLIDDTFNIHGYSVPINAEMTDGLLDLMMKRNILFTPNYVQLFRVTYTDLDRLLRPTVIHRTEKEFTLTTNDIGIFKKLEWQDQQEWRYRLTSMPLNIREMDYFSETHDYELLLEHFRSREELPFIDLPLKDDIFDDLEVMCGPSMSDESKDELRVLLEKYAPNATIKHSGIKVRP